MKRIVRKALLVPYTFVLMNWAAVAGLYYFARGSRDLWTPLGQRHSGQWPVASENAGVRNGR